MRLHEQVCRSIDVEIGDHPMDLACETGLIGRLHMSVAVLFSSSSNPSASLPLRVMTSPSTQAHDGSAHGLQRSKRARMSGLSGVAVVVRLGSKAPNLAEAV
jgi:hypothetical protein